MADRDLITILQTESWRNVHSHVLVPLLITCILWDEVKVLAANNCGSVHFGRDDSAGKDTATDGDKTGEGAFLICA